MPELTKVELLKQDGTLVKQANRSGITFTIKLSAKDMSLEEAGNLTGGAYMLRLTYPETATAKMDGGFGDGENGDDRWLTVLQMELVKAGKETFIYCREWIRIRILILLPLSMTIADFDSGHSEACQ